MKSFKNVFENSQDLKYYEKVYERSGKNLFWSIKNSDEVLDNLKARDFNATVCLHMISYSSYYLTS